MEIYDIAFAVKLGNEPIMITLPRVPISIGDEVLIVGRVGNEALRGLEISNCGGKGIEREEQAP